jgi:hypothetical protein
MRSGTLTREEEVEEELDFYGRRDLVKPHVKPSAKNIAIAATPFLIQKMYEDLAPYRLTVVRSAHRKFIIADSPVSVFPQYVDPKEEAYFSADTEFVFPVTSMHAVVITAELGRPQFVEVGHDVVAIVNARTARAAAQEVYCAPDYRKICYELI